MVLMASSTSNNSTKSGLSNKAIDGSTRIHLTFLGLKIQNISKEKKKCNKKKSPKHEIIIKQQVTNGPALVILKTKCSPKDEISFYSRREIGRFFSVIIYVDGVIDLKINTCCEYRHVPGTRLGGPNGHFKLNDIQCGKPCYMCRIREDEKSIGKKCTLWKKNKKFNSKVNSKNRDQKNKSKINVDDRNHKSSKLVSVDEFRKANKAKEIEPVTGDNDETFNEDLSESSNEIIDNSVTNNEEETDSTSTPSEEELDSSLDDNDTDSSNEFSENKLVLH